VLWLPVSVHYISPSPSSSTQQEIDLQPKSTSRFCSKVPKLLGTYQGPVQKIKIRTNWKEEKGSISRILRTTLRVDCLIIITTFCIYAAADGIIDSTSHFLTIK
jgi:hypothetical protein